MSSCDISIQATADCSKKIKVIHTADGIQRLSITDGMVPWEGDPNTLQDCAACEGTSPETLVDLCEGGASSLTGAGDPETVTKEYSMEAGPCQRFGGIVAGASTSLQTGAPDASDYPLTVNVPAMAQGELWLLHVSYGAAEQLGDPTGSLLQSAQITDITDSDLPNPSRICSTDRTGDRIGDAMFAFEIGGEVGGGTIEVNWDVNDTVDPNTHHGAILISWVKITETGGLGVELSDLDLANAVIFDEERDAGGAVVRTLPAIDMGECGGFMAFAGRHVQVVTEPLIPGSDFDLSYFNGLCVDAQFVNVDSGSGSTELYDHASWYKRDNACQMGQTLEYIAPNSGPVVYNYESNRTTGSFTYGGMGCAIPFECTEINTLGSSTELTDLCESSQENTNPVAVNAECTLTVAGEVTVVPGGVATITPIIDGNPITADSVTVSNLNGTAPLVQPIGITSTVVATGPVAAGATFASDARLEATLSSGSVLQIDRHDYECTLTPV